MADLGWQQNATFTNNEISFASYVQMLIKRVPPISELYFQQRPADSAFQMPGTLITREHIRWWTVGSHIHIAALSRDDEIAIKYYLHLLTLLHDIDPLVDLSRDRLASQVINSKGFEVAGVAYINAPVVEGAFSDFRTDGGVLVLTDKGQPLSSELAHCLQIKAIT